jgi:hypothetical protein
VKFDEENAFIPAGVSSSSFLIYFSSTLPTASAQDSIARPLSHDTEGQRMALNCFTTEATSMPDLNTSEINLLVASS